MFYIRVYGTFLWHATVGRFFENIVHNARISIVAFRHDLTIQVLYNYRKYEKSK